MFTDGLECLQQLSSVLDARKRKSCVITQIKQEPRLIAVVRRMVKDENDRWLRLLEAQCLFQKLYAQESPLGGGSAVALHLGHRLSYDADYLVANLKSGFAELLDRLEADPDWVTARTQSGKIILGNFQGVETGLRQLIRTRPIETCRIETPFGDIIVPTQADLLRMKSWMILVRNMTRDYVDFAALVDAMGEAQSSEVLASLDTYYSDVYQGRLRKEASPVAQILKQLMDPRPADLDRVDLSIYKGLAPAYQDWSRIATICHQTGMLLVQRIQQSPATTLEDPSLPSQNNSDRTASPRKTQKPCPQNPENDEGATPR